MMTLSEDFQYHDSYFVVGNPRIVWIAAGVIAAIVVWLYKLWSKQPAHATRVPSTNKRAVPSPHS